MINLTAATEVSHPATLLLATSMTLAIVAVIVLLVLVFIALFLRRRLNVTQTEVGNPPFDCDFSKYEVAVPLKSAFRFAHEPLRGDSNGRFVGREAELKALALRIMFSEGGSFLVTGYRGVGKTTFVNRVVRQLEDMVPWAQSIFGETKIIDVQLNLARPLTAAQLMHHIIRRLYERLVEKGVYSRLSSSLKDDLKLAYQRTSFNMSRTLGEQTEKSLGLSEASVGASFLKASLKGAMSFKRTQKEDSEYKYLGYDDKAAESDVVRLSRQLSGAFIPEMSLRDRARSFIGRKQQPKPSRLIIVFVFDELDKLEEFTVTKNGRTTTVIDELLSALKNVFTTSGVSFVFVAGKDTQERWLEDLGKGDSVYESVFAYDKYLPCMWSDVDALCDGFVDWQFLPEGPRQKFCLECGTPAAHEGLFCAKCGTEFPPPTITIWRNPATTPGANGPNPCDSCSVTSKEEMFCGKCGLYVGDVTIARSVFTDFKRYLDYRGRGIPRRVIRGFNEYVFWSRQRPVLVFTKNDVRRIRVYSELQDLLVKNEQRLFGNLHEEVWGTLQDKRRLAVYYLTDWLLRQGNAEFTIKDAVVASKGLSSKIAPAEEIALNVISDLVSVMVEGEFVMEVGERLDKVQIGDVSAKQEKRYKLMPRRLIEMRGDADVFEAESYVFRNVAMETDRVAHYKLLEKIGSGGMGTVYRAWDEHTDQVVAVKILSREFASDPQAAERFKRESKVMSQLRHPNIVKCYETGEDNGRAFIAMEFVEGIDLVRVLRTLTRLDSNAAISLGRSIADGLHYIHSQGFVRNDLKPGNILLSNKGNVYLMDFGITKQRSGGEEQTVTYTGVLVGTPYYMSPEQCMHDPVDERSDIYSFGVVLYEMVTGELPFKGETIQETIIAHISKNATPPSQFVAELSPGIEEIILRCLEKKPDKRYATSSELLEQLKKASEDLPPVDLASLVSSVLETGRKAAVHAFVDTRDMEFQVLRARRPAPDPVIIPNVDESNSGPVPSPSAESFSAPGEDPSSQPPEVAPPAAPFSPLPLRRNQDRDSGSPVVPEQAKFFGRARLQLISLDSPLAPIYPLVKDQTQIGRAADNDIVLDEVYSSRFHATIDFRDGFFYIRDLNTSNGTFVNGNRVIDSVVLNDGDRIKIGNSVLMFEN